MKNAVNPIDVLGKTGNNELRKQAEFLKTEYPRCKTCGAVIHDGGNVCPNCEEDPFAEPKENVHFNPKLIRKH